MRVRIARMDQQLSDLQARAGFNPAILANANPFWKQLTWFIDPANVTGTAKDTNSGLTRTTALRSYAEIIRRWGTTAPQIIGTLTVTWLSSCSAAQLLSDPVDIEALSYNGQIVYQGDITTPIISGAVLAGVVAYASPNQRWACRIPGLAAGAASLDLLVHDRTADAWFFTYADLGGGLFEITEPSSYNPAQLYCQPTRLGGIPIANGHLVDVYRLPAVNVTYFRPVQVVDDYTHAQSQLQTMLVSNPYGNNVVAGYGETYFGGAAYVGVNRCCFYNSVGVAGGSAVTISGSMLREGIYATSGGIVNVVCGSVENYITAQSTTTIMLDGWTLVDNVAAGLQLDRAMLRFGRVNWRGAIDTLPSANQGIGLGFSDGRLSVGNGFSFIGDPVLPSGVIDGNATIALHTQIALVYNGTAVSCFPGVTGFTLDGAGTASSFTGAVWNTGIAINAVNLDAAAGVAGFGGYAYGLKGSSISQYT